VYGRALESSGTLRIVCAIDRSAEQDALDALLRLRSDLEATVARRTAELASREATYRVLADLSPQILWQADPTGRITYVSKSWHQLVGRVADDGKMPRWLAATHPDDRAATLAAFETASHSGEPLRVRRRYRSPQGGYRAFLSVGAPVRGPDGCFAGWVGVDTDVSELESHATRLAQTNADLEAMSYTVSHDLRAPVQVIRGFVEAVLSNRMGRVDDAAARGALERVLRNALRMDELITDLLALSRLSRETLRLESVDPLALARDVGVLVADRHPGRTIEWAAEGQDGAGGAVALRADRRLLQVVFENLFDNAVKFTPGSHACCVEVRAQRSHDTVVLQVCDRGVGFPVELAERLFRPFQRLHAGSRFPGTGIGLATVRRIVQLHGGTIGGRNRDGGGAVFEICLPSRHEATGTTTEKS
jgi:PAS domain S-box-containing protein